MQDAITAVINSYDVQGKYLDSSAMDKLRAFFATGELRVRAAATIAANASNIIKEAAAKALLYSDLTRPGGNMYTTRRYAACIRDMDYYLRYGHLCDVGGGSLHPRRAGAQRPQRNLQLAGGANWGNDSGHPSYERSNRCFGGP
jgi:hypothetical protein